MERERETKKYQGFLKAVKILDIKNDTINDNLISNLMAKYDDNMDEYKNNKDLIDCLYLIDIENGSIEQSLKKINIPKDVYSCMVINIKVDILQKQIFLEIYRAKKIPSTTDFTLLIKKWYIYYQQLNCMNNINLDKLYDFNRSNYKYILVSLTNKIPFLYY
jgi:hypothetical protein